jgi:UDPglucose 6-dehydrogenase
VFDPVAAGEAAHALADVRRSIEFAGDVYDAVADVDAVVIMTEWNEFRSLDLERLRLAMRTPILFDTRNVIDPKQARQMGFEYLCTGRQSIGAGDSVAVGS